MSSNDVGFKYRNTFVLSIIHIWYIFTYAKYYWLFIKRTSIIYLNLWLDGLNDTQSKYQTRRCRCHFQSVINTDMSICLLLVTCCRSLYSLHNNNNSNFHLLSSFYILSYYWCFFSCLIYVLNNYCVHVYSHISFLFFFSAVTPIPITLSTDACFLCKGINVRANILYMKEYQCWKENLL